MADNIFRVLGVQTREDSVSNALAHAINHSPRFNRLFLSRICERDPAAYEECVAHTRVSSGNGIPDILIVGRKSVSEADLIIIENKLKAEEGDDQTERYAARDSIDHLHRRLCANYHIRPSFVFLSLFPDQEPKCAEYVTKCYDLLSPFTPDYASRSTLADTLIHDWLSLVSSFYGKLAIGPQDDVLTKLQDQEGLESGYLYFRGLLSSLPLAHDMYTNCFFRSSQQGRRYYGAQITKEGWYPAEMVCRDGTWNLDAYKNFYIHFEPQYDVLNHVMRLPLHYEVYPYNTEAWVKSNVDKAQYSDYLAQRARFSAKLEPVSRLGWTISGGYNQLARADIDFNGKTSGTLKAEMARKLNDVAPIIDAVMQELSCK
jgi:hypothetical protein